VSTTPSHPDRLMTRERPITPPASVDLAVEELASLLARGHDDEMEVLEAVVRAAGRMVRTRRRAAPLDDERPAPAMGSWSLENGMLDVGPRRELTGERAPRAG
jgi:hypothetical protein